jgi:hypothetical protein
MRHAVLIVLCGSVLGCEDPVGLSPAEAREALHQVVLSTAGQATVADLIELSTTFSRGLAPADAATELAGQIGESMPCASPSVTGTTIALAYGAGCEYEGRSYSGASSVTVERNEDTSVEVTHLWTGVSDGVATVEGSSAVEWSGEGQGLTRHVVHELSWTSTAGEPIASSGDHLQALMRPLEGLAGGLLVNGHRAWTVGGERWDASVNEIEIYADDLVPEAGSYSLFGPGGREYEILFVVREDDFIDVTVEDRYGFQLLEVDRAGQVVATD